MNEKSGKQTKPSHFLLRPDYDSPDGLRQAVIDTFEAIHGRKSTPEELAELDRSIQSSSPTNTTPERAAENMSSEPSDLETPSDPPPDSSSNTRGADQQPNQNGGADH